MHNNASLRRGAKALWVLGWVVIAMGLVSAVSGAFRTAELMERMGAVGRSANAANWALAMRVGL